MYRFSDRVRFSELDEEKKMRVPSIFRVFQDCSDYQSEELGIGHSFLMQERRAWILLYWQAFIERYPRDRETFTAETRPWKFHHFMGYRNFALYDAAGERMVAANSVWSLVDVDRMRPVRPTEEITGLYGTDERIPMEYSDSRKIRLPEQMEEREPFPVRRGSLDMNHHVNNVQYIDMACEYFPEELTVYELRAEYRVAAKMGDIICPRVGQEGGWTVVALCSTDGTPYAVVEARGREGEGDV